MLIVKLSKEAVRGFTCSPGNQSRPSASYKLLDNWIFKPVIMEQ